MPTIEETLIRLEADTLLLRQELRKGDRAIEGTVRKAGRQLDRFDRKVQTFGRNLGRSFGQLNLSRALGPLALGAGGVGLFRGLDTALGDADKIAKVADSVGITTEALQEYRLAAELSGVESGKFDSGLQALAKRMGELRAGTGTLVEFLKKNNQALIDQLSGAQSTEEALDIILRAMDGMESQFDRTALAAAAFGRSAGVDMTNLLRDGIGAIDEMRASARKTGAILDDALIRQAERLNDEMTKVSAVIDTNFKTALLEIAPEMQKLKLFFSEVLVGAGAFLSLFGETETITRLGSEIVVLNRRLEVLKNTDISDLSSGFDLMGDAADEAESSLARLEERDRKILELETQILEKRQALKGLLQGGSAEGFGTGGGTSLDTGGTSSRVDTFQRDLQALIDRLDPASARIRAFNEDMELLERGRGQIGENRFEQLRKALEATQFEELASDLAAVREELERGDDAIDEYRIALDILWEALQRQLITGPEYEALLAKLNQKFVEGANKVPELAGELENLEDVGRDTGRALSDAFFDVFQGIESASDALRSFALQLSRIGFQHFVTGPLTSFLGGLGGSISVGADGGLVSRGGIVRAAGGGLITGPGGPRSDNIRALLSPGEFVSDARTTARNLPELQAMNRGESFDAIAARNNRDIGRVLRFANGGLVGSATASAGAVRSGSTLTGPAPQFTFNMPITVQGNMSAKDAGMTGDQIGRRAFRKFRELQQRGI